jgi:hypothetical protein
VRIRYCTKCCQEYRPDIVNCAECGALLEDHDDEIEPEATLAPATQPPADLELPEGFEAIHTSRDIDQLPPLADSLVASGIDCRIRDAPGSRQVVYRLFVHAKDRAAAIAVIEASLHPHAATEFDPEHGYARCPACNTPLQPRAAECPECGLPLFDTEVTCPACGSTAEASAERCPDCGHILAEPA